MKTLIEYINKEKYHLNTLYDQNNNIISEELDKLINTKHSSTRKLDQSVRKAVTNISDDDIKYIICLCDNQITDACLNKILKTDSIFGIIKKDDIFWLSCILELVKFNIEDLTYDLKIITTNKTEYKYKFNNVVFYLDIENDGRINTVYQK